jgi:translation initiation factor 2B subunit (eIF-2B alpha/beta/delta family)
MKPECLFYFQNTLKDNKSGSSTITGKIIKDFDHWFSENPLVSKNDLLQVSKSIFNVFPNFAILFHFLNQLLLFVETLPEEIPADKLQGFLSDYRSEWKNTTKKAAQNFLEEINIKTSNILLHSNSSAVLEIFKETDKKECNIWQTVSSPANEGILQAENLSSLGFKVNLIHENEIWLFEKMFDMVILGTDLITNEFFINKTGSRSIGLLKKPLYLISESRKVINEEVITPKLFKMLTSEKCKPSEELYNGKDERIKVYNLYFEQTPLDVVKGIITEKGMFKPWEVMNKTAAFQRLSGYWKTNSMHNNKFS